jgi:type I restriction enzyme, R subunit
MRYLQIFARIDLLKQAEKEFRSRGLIVHSINSKNAFANDIKSTKLF